MAFQNGWLVRASLRATKTGVEVVNTLHYECDDPAIPNDKPASLQALADRLRDDLMVPYRALFTSAWTVHPIVVTEELDPLNPADPREQRQSGASAAGTRSNPGDTLPTAATLVATETTNFVGRSFRGRVFLGGDIAETDQTAGNFSTGAGSFWVLAGTFLDAIPKVPDIIFGPTTATVQLVVYSRTRRARGQTPYFSRVSGYTRRPAVKWLRSREPGQ